MKLVSSNKIIWIKFQSIRKFLEFLEYFVKFSSYNLLNAIVVVTSMRTVIHNKMQEQKSNSSWRHTCMGMGMDKLTGIPTRTTNIDIYIYEYTSIHLAYHATVDRSSTKKQTNKFSYRSCRLSLPHSQLVWSNGEVCLVRLCLMLFAYSTWCTMYTNTLCIRPAKGGSSSKQANNSSSNSQYCRVYVDDNNLKME